LYHIVDDPHGDDKVLDERANLPVDWANVALDDKLHDLLAQDFLLFWAQARLSSHQGGTGLGIVDQDTRQSLPLILLGKSETEQISAHQVFKTIVFAGLQ
jgi:hypothetical protein